MAVGEICSTFKVPAVGRGGSQALPAASSKEVVRQDRRRTRCPSYKKGPSTRNPPNSESPLCTTDILSVVSLSRAFRESVASLSNSYSHPHLDVLRTSDTKRVHSSVDGQDVRRTRKALPSANRPTAKALFVRRTSCPSLACREPVASLSRACRESVASLSNSFSHPRLDVLRTSDAKRVHSSVDGQDVRRTRKALPRANRPTAKAPFVRRTSCPSRACRESTDHVANLSYASSSAYISREVGNAPLLELALGFGAVE